MKVNGKSFICIWEQCANALNKMFPQSSIYLWPRKWFVYSYTKLILHKTLFSTRVYIWWQLFYCACAKGSFNI